MPGGDMDTVAYRLASLNAHGDFSSKAMLHPRDKWRSATPVAAQSYADRTTTLRPFSRTLGSV
jgi:hypothetical protein